MIDGPEARFPDEPLEAVIGYVDKNWEDPDYNELYRDSSVILFGDSDHRNKNSSGGLAKQMQKLKDARVEYLCIELSRDDKDVSYVEKFNKTGDVSLVDYIIERTKTPESIGRLFKSAFEAGIQLYLIDLPEEVRNNYRWIPDMRTFRRSEYMGEMISKLSKENPNSKIAVFCGLAHLVDCHIPSVLSKNNIRYKKVAVIPAGPREMTNKELPRLPAAQAVSRCNKEDITGYVSLKGAYNLDGFIYFPN